jgi:hypothetical protein
MSNINIVLYTLGSSDPCTFDDEVKQREELEKHFQLISQLSDIGSFSLNNAILKTARFITSNTDLATASGKKYEEFCNDYFGKDKYKAIDEKDDIYLIEWINYGSNKDYIPLQSWRIDTKITKAVLMRSLIHESMPKVDLERIKDYYNLDIYWRSVKIGGIDDTATIKYVNEYNNYLYEFYKRSDNPDKNRLEYYRLRADTCNMLLITNKSNTIDCASFSINITMTWSLEQLYSDIDEFSNNVKYYAKRLYEVNYVENMFKAGGTGGNKNPKVIFGLWDRYLRIYDLYKEYADKGVKVENRHFDRIGNKIVKEFKVFEKYKPNDLRKEIKSEYNEAVRLIEQSVQGYLS